ncbi:MAG: hypothetical protein HY904_08875 [Deltaproteobacteria bacterium]|nr:hypothetical protein [Deltaproteobacteria bacterium]
MSCRHLIGVDDNPESQIRLGRRLDVARLEQVFEAVVLFNPRRVRRRCVEVNRGLRRSEAGADQVRDREEVVLSLDEEAVRAGPGRTAHQRSSLW